MNRVPVVLALLLMTAAACSSETTSGTPPAADAGTPSTPGDPSVLAGTFQIKIADGATSFNGKVYDAASPSDVIWETTATDGDCTLLVPRVPFCDTPCGSNSVCVEDNVCGAYPTARSVGAVTVTGVSLTSGASTFTSNAVVNSYQPASGAELAFPPFAEGAAIRVAAAGDYYAAFAVEAKGIAALELGFTSLPLVRGQAAKLTWTRPADPSISTVQVKLDISHHGGSRGKIECATADDGELELGASLVSALLDLGVAGFPTVIVTRKAMGSTTIAPGRVELSISAVVEREVTLEGVTSCNDSSACPSGQTCQSDLTCK